MQISADFSRIFLVRMDYISSKDQIYEYMSTYLVSFQKFRIEIVGL